jgi:hypothetical protein
LASAKKGGITEPNNSHTVKPNTKLAESHDPSDLQEISATRDFNYERRKHEGKVIYASFSSNNEQSDEDIKSPQAQTIEEWLAEYSS